MSRLYRLAGVSVFALSLLPMSAALAATDQQTLVQRAQIVVSDLRRDPQFGAAKSLMHRARAIIIVPRLYKAGFFFGGEGGKGVLLAHNAAGNWSAPAFYTIGSASFGLQIGLEQSEMVLFVMSQKALNAVLQNEFKIGVDAGIAVVTLGSNVEGATTSAAGPDIVTWASSSGAYAGISLNGSIIAPSADDDRAYYGRPETTQQIVYGTRPDGTGLRQALTSVQ